MWDGYILVLFSCHYDNECGMGIYWYCSHYDNECGTGIYWYCSQVTMIMSVRWLYLGTGTSPSEEAQELETSGGWQESEMLREDNGDRIAYERLK